MDPFQALRDNGVSTFGYAVTDAPDQRLREIAIKAQQGQGLNDRDVKRLAARQGVELEAARVAQKAVGSPGAGVPSTVFGYLAGTRLDPTVQQAGAQQARDILDPVGAQLRQFGVELPGATPEEKSDVLANYQIADRIAAQTGTTRQRALADISPSMQVPEQPAPGVAPVASPDSADDTQISYTDRLAKYAPKPNASREAALVEEAQSLYGPGAKISALQYRNLRAATSPEIKQVYFSDPLTGDKLSVDALVDPKGRIYEVRGQPVLVEEGPARKATKAAVDELADWNTKKASTAEQITKLDSALGILKSDAQVTGPFVGNIDKIPVLGPAVNQLIAPNLRAVEADILSVGQSMIKQVFGSNPAQQEAQRLLDRMFDKTVPEAENARRAAIFRDTMVRAAQLNEAKANYLARTGTLAGFKAPSLQDLVSEASQAMGGTQKAAPPATSPGRARADAAAKRAAEAAKRYSGASTQ